MSKQKYACPKCHAGVASLRCSTSKAGGTTTQTINCLRCGYTAERIITPAGAQKSIQLTPSTTCAKCGKESRYLSRGLCSKCWDAEKQTDTLDQNYPSRRGGNQHNHGAQKNKIACARCGKSSTNHGRGLCSSCYIAEKQAGTLNQNYPKLKIKIVCARCGKTRAHTGRGLCSSCYNTEWRIGTLEQNYPLHRVVNTKKEKNIMETQPVPVANTKKGGNIMEIQPAPVANTKFEQQLDNALESLRTMLLEKNASYGNSVLDPVRIFSRANQVEQICVRMDDKLSRLARGSEMPDEDTETDLLVKLVLLRIARKESAVA